MTTYLCTCGTSAAKNLDQRISPEWVAAQGGVSSAAATLHRSFGSYRIDDPAALTRQLSAEVHSLARMGVSATDRVILFSSETDEGRACAEALVIYLGQQLPGIDCRAEVIDGLQVRDARAFRSRGVINFTQKVLAEIDAWGAGQCILNPTGGFKSLVPYTVLIGMIKGVQARYIFEQSSTLIDLPLMPLEFARAPLEPLRPLIERIERDSAIPTADFEQALSYQQRQTLGPLFETEGRDTTLSPVGLLVWEEMRSPRHLTPYLSRRAIDDLIAVRAIEGARPDDFIERVAANPEQLEAATHEAWADGLRWLKPGQHTRDRYLVSVEDGRLLVWRILDHGEYDVLIDQARSGNGPRGGKPAAAILEQRRQRYEPFIRLDLYESQ